MAVVGNTTSGKGYRPVRFFKFIVLTYSVRELLRFLPKLINFLKIYNTRYLGSE